MSAKSLAEDGAEVRSRLVAVKAIPEKLEFLCRHFSMTRAAFIVEFSKSYSSSTKSIREWCEGTKTPKDPSLRKLSEYWNSKISGFKHVMWVIEFDHFRSYFVTLLRQQRILPIELPYNLIMISEDEIEGLTGTYVIYRSSFFNDSRICKEFLLIKKPASGDRSYLDVALYAASDTDSERGSNRQQVDNVYSGKMYKYGDTYYMFISATHENISRIRMICFPVTNNSGVRKRWGIISAGASVDRLPVAARILASKIDDAAEVPSEKPRRYRKDQLKLTERDARFICNDIKKSPTSPEGKDYVLTVSTGFVDLH